MGARAFKLTLAVTLVAIGACRGGCGGDDRSPPAMPHPANEGSGLLGALAAGEGSGTGLSHRPDHVRRDDERYDADVERAEGPVVAWVNDHTIHRSELDARLRRRMILQRGSERERSPQWRDRDRVAIVRELVEEQMLRQAMDEAGITITEAELAESVQAEIGRVFHDETHFERYLERRGFTREEWIEARRFEMRLERFLATRVEIGASEEEVHQYYERFRESWRAPERVQASTITVRLRREADQQAVDAARARLDELREMIVEEGTDFAEVAQAHSQSPDRYRGGDMGWIYRDDPDLDPETARVLFSMAAGDVSEPVRTPLGMQIFWVRDHRTEGYRDFEEVRARLVDVVEQREEQQARAALIRELERRYEVGYNEEAYGLENR